MNARRSIVMICFWLFGLVAALYLAKFLGTKVFDFGSGYATVIESIALYSLLCATALSAFAFAKSRRNLLYMWLFLLFFGAIVVFRFVLV